MTINHLTIEQLNKHFPNNFELAQKAIAAAHIMMRGNEEVSAPHLLDGMARHPDRYDLDELEEQYRRDDEEEEGRQHDAER